MLNISLSHLNAISLSIKAACKHLNEKLPEDEEIDDALTEFRLTGEQVFKDIQNTLSKRKSNSASNVQFELIGNGDDDDGDANANENRATSTARGKRGGRSTAAASGRGRGSSRGNSRTEAAASDPPAASGSTSTVSIDHRLISFSFCFKE